jgi:Flp pilus assembly protein TadD
LPFSGSIDFVGRDDDLLELHRRLQSDRPLVISAIAGMGGIGKTELALHYAYERLSLYAGGICWLRSIETMAIDILLFAEQFHGVLPDQDSEGVQRVQDCWRKWPATATLVVIDNAPSYAEIAPILPPVRSQFKMLLTSRSRFEPPIDNYEIKVLSLEASIELLQRLLKDQRIDRERQQAEEICVYLGRLPLALELVGRYLQKRPDLSLAKFWGRLQEQGIQDAALEKQQQMNGAMTAELGVIAAFELSWQGLSAEARLLAAFLSIFAPAEIPWVLVEQCLAELPLAGDVEGLANLRDLELCAGSLLDRKRDGFYELHQLLREFFALKLAEFPEREGFMDSFAQELTTIAKTVEQIVIVSERSWLLQVLPHWIVATTLTEYLPDDDKTWCCTALARLHESLSQFRDAEIWYLRSLEIREEQQGENHPDTASSLNNLAALYYSTGRYLEAEPLYLRSLAISKKQLGENHPDTSTSLNNLAALYESTGRYSEAEPLYVRSLEIIEKQLGENHPNTASSVNNLAGLYRVTGRYSEAEPLYVRSLAIREKQLGANHPDTATSLNNLAGLYESTGRYSEAEPLYVRSLEIREKQLGENHPSTATSLNNLAGLYRVTGRYSEAEPLYVRSLEIREKQLGENHPDTASSLNNFAGLYESTGRYSEAEPLYVRSLEIREKQLGANHPDTASSLNNLAGLYYSTGRYSEAEPLYVRSLEIREKQLGANHPDTASSLNNFAGLYESTGRYSEAEPLYIRSLAIREEQLGANHPSTASSLNNLAGLYYSTGRYSEAEPLYIRSIQIVETTLGVDHPSTQTIRNNLALLRHTQNLATTKIAWWRRVIKIIVWPFSFCYRSTRWLMRQIFKI